MPGLGSLGQAVGRPSWLLGVIKVASLRSSPSCEPEAKAMWGLACVITGGVGRMKGHGGEGRWSFPGGRCRVREAVSGAIPWL